MMSMLSSALAIADADAGMYCVHNNIDFAMGSNACKADMRG